MRQPRKMSPFEPPWNWDRDREVNPWAPLLDLPAHLVPDLPEPVTLWLDLEGAPSRVQLTTRGRADADRACPRGSLADVVVFDREELRALIAGVEADRIWRKDLLGLCFDKWRKPEHRLTEADALAGANPDPQGWSLERMLARLGATLERVELGDGQAAVSADDAELRMRSAA